MYLRRAVNCDDRLIHSFRGVKNIQDHVKYYKRNGKIAYTVFLAGEKRDKSILNSKLEQQRRHHCMQMTDVVNQLPE